MTTRRRIGCVIGLAGFSAAVWLWAARPDETSWQPIIRPAAIIATEPVPHDGDSADDPAIWLCAEDPSRSMIIGTDKHGGLISYDLSGKQLQIVSGNSWPDNVDVIYDFPLGGRKVDLAVAGTRAKQELGIKVWTIDAKTRQMADVTAGGAIPTFGHTEPYGTGVYHSLKTGKFYCFVNNKKGEQEQYELIDGGNGKVGGVKVRSFKLPSITEGCVADDETGFVYIAEESVGIWKYPAEPDGGSEGKLIARTGEHGLKGDVEGLTLYCAAGGKGYLIASSQGNSQFKVYRRDGNHEFICTIIPRKGDGPNAIDAVDDTDGVAVTNRPAGPNFPNGFLVVQDGHNDKGNQNFKVYRWEDIAGKDLLIDTQWDPRAQKALAPAVVDPPQAK